MAPVRKDAADFEEIPDSLPRRLKCLVCSSNAGTVSLLPTSIANHRKSPKHASALRATAGPTPSGPTLLQPPVPKDPSRPAVMTLAAHYADDPLDSDEDMPLAGISGMEHGNSLFNEAISYGGEIFDAAGEQVMFSAGEIPAVDSSESNRIWREMENLGYYDHTIFADMTPMMADMFDKTDDCTVSDAVRAMAAMGIDESDEENDDDSSPAGVFNEDWAPHGSKTVGF
ncbi:hypothetical protein B0H14DRAFT_3615232 [Mycena olivaceomarginata]|nr:hypothetical protein B0H14DRAFT_3615232 [Mycena olivaceomarginata]